MTDSDIDEIIKALANPVRCAILSWLKDPERNFPPQPHQPFEVGVCVGRIYEKAALSQSTISAYLAILQRAGLVVSTRVGQWTYYRRNQGVIAEFLHALEQRI